MECQSLFGCIPSIYTEKNLPWEFGKEENRAVVFMAFKLKDVEQVVHTHFLPKGRGNKLDALEGRNLFLSLWMKLSLLGQLSFFFLNIGTSSYLAEFHSQLISLCLRQTQYMILFKYQIYKLYFCSKPN